MWGQGVTMTESVQVYQDVTTLNTEERKALYREILEEDHFGERSKRFTRALKTLMFKGEIESYEQGLDDETELGGRRENDLTHLVPAYLCLASPDVSVDSFAQILGRYNEAVQASVAGQIVIYLDGNPGLSEAYFTRVQHMMLALARLAPADSSIGGLGEGRAIRLFNRFLSRISYKANSSRCLWSLFLDQFDKGFAEVHKKFGSREEDIDRLIKELFGSAPNHPEAYTDAGFISFCQRYFFRRLSPEFLSYLDDIYQSIPEDRRIGLHGDKILHFAEQA